MNEEREPTKFESDLASIIGQLQIATARSIAALAEAVAKQPGIDREKLLDDWFAIIPPVDKADRIESVLYRSIDQLLQSDHALPPHKQGDR